MITLLYYINYGKIYLINSFCWKKKIDNRYLQYKPDCIKNWPRDDKKLAARPVAASFFCHLMLHNVQRHSFPWCAFKEFWLYSLLILNGKPLILSLLTYTNIDNYAYAYKCMYIYKHILILPIRLRYPKPFSVL